MRGDTWGGCGLELVMRFSLINGLFGLFAGVDCTFRSGANSNVPAGVNDTVVWAIDRKGL